MSEYAGQDNGTLRVTIREAATRLGVTEAAVRKRIQRGSLGKELGQDGRVYVYLDLSQDTSHPESQVHRDPAVEELVEELRDRVASQERQLERHGDETERLHRIIAGLAQANAEQARTIRAIEAPASEEPTQDAETVEEEPEGAEPRSATGGAQETTPRRPWWRRMFGG